jgi:hypothetical protein
MTVNDRALAIAEARAALSAAKAILPADRIDWQDAVVTAYAALADPISAEGGGDAVAALFDSAGATLRAFAAGNTSMLANLQGAMAGNAASYALVGKPAAPLRGWQRLDTGAVTSEPGAGTTSEHEVLPRRGKVSLLLFVDASCGGSCYPTYAIVKRLHARYAAAGLDVILVTATRGYFRTAHTPSPAVEADSVARYFLHFLKLPVTVVVEETTFSTDAIDGRRINAQPANKQAYPSRAEGIVVDAKGVIRFVSSLNPARERVLSAVIGAALSGP